MLWLKRFWPLLLGILYLVSPIDAIPDTLLGLGWTDDIVVLLLAYWFFKRVLPKRSLRDSRCLQERNSRGNQECLS
jgi:uncharacterized membrane protein YkvA (DUF1232 family)